MDQAEQELVDAVSKLAREQFAPRAAQYDRNGTFPHENFAELRALGIPGMALPKALGGLEISAEAHMRIVEEIAYGDASTAVALNMHLLIADILRLFPMFPHRDAVLKDVATNGALICGAGSVPTAELDNRGTGFRFTDDGDHLVASGRAGFASGSDGATYTMIGGPIDRGEGQDPDFALTIPRLGTPGLTVRNNWDAMGMRATASHDIVAEGLRIPKAEALIVPAALAKALVETRQAGVTQDRARGALGILAIWLGLAQAAFDEAIAYVKRRHGYLAGDRSLTGLPTPGYRSEEAWAQMALGHVEHWLETGRVVFYHAVRALDRTFSDPQQFTRLLVRTVYHLRRMSEEVAQGTMRVCGAHAYVKGHPLERIFRDMVGSNVMAWKTDQLQLLLGQGALGMPIGIAGPAGT